METVAPIEDPTQVATRWQDTMLSLEKEYEQEPEVLKIGGVPIGTLGNFSASIG
ncbi:mobilization protein, partial [Bacteroides xylanisolvens]